MKNLEMMAVLAAVWMVMMLLISVESSPLPSEQNEAAEPAKNSTGSGLTQYLPTAETMSTVVGAALGEEDCLKKTACQAGSYVSQVTGKELVLMMLDRFVPRNWQDTLQAFKEAATYSDDCNKQYTCRSN